MINCLNHVINSFHGYILKYERDVTSENLILYSDKHDLALDGTKLCSRCFVWKNPQDYQTKRICTLCANIKNDRCRNIDGFFKNMANTMRSNAKRKAEKGRKNAGICTVDFESLKKIYEVQNGLCYYSGLPLSLIPMSEWQASPERIKNTIGYTLTNTKLVCLEFNIGHCQWNKKKIKALEMLRHDYVDIEVLKGKIEETKKNNIKNNKKNYQCPHKHKIKIENDIKYYECYLCKEYKLITDFSIKKDSIQPKIHCKYCSNVKKEKIANSLKGYLWSRLHGAKVSAKRRGNKKRNDDSGIFELSIEDLCDKILEQKGKCYYSG